MANQYATRESIARAASYFGVHLHAQIDQEIDAASRAVDALCHRRFIPITATRSYRWPQFHPGPSGTRLYLDDDLLSVSGLTKDDDTATAIASTDYFLEPAGDGPPYSRIDLDLASSAYFSSANTPQRAIRVTGSWGYSNDTVAAGTLAAALSDTTGTVLDCSDGSLVGVGDTLLCESEQLFVAERAAITTTTTLAASLTEATPDEGTVSVADGTKVKQGEVILIDSERMLVLSVVSNTLTVRRAWDGSTQATHSSGATVYSFRRLTVTRGQNGTTAATHLITTAIRRFAPPADIVRLTRAYAINALHQNAGGWLGVGGGGETAINMTMRSLAKIEEDVRKQYRRHSVATVGAIE